MLIHNQTQLHSEFRKEKNVDQLYLAIRGCLSCSVRTNGRLERQDLSKFSVRMIFRLAWLSTFRQVASPKFIIFSVDVYGIGFRLISLLRMARIAARQKGSLLDLYFNELELHEQFLVLTVSDHKVYYRIKKKP